MKYINELSSMLNQQFKWHKSRIDCFSQMLLALFMVRSINLSELAVAMGSCAKIESRYRRVRRFFAHFSIDFDMIARWIFALFFTKESKVYLAIDRTNWFFGKAKINIFMLSVCYEGISIPLFWTLLNKAGSTTAQEQIALLERFINVFDKSLIQGVLGDREFPNKTLIGWLTQQKIPFYLRIKGNADVCIGRKKYKAAYQLFSHLNPMQHTVFGMRMTLFGQPLWLAASKNNREQLMIIVTNQHPRNAIACYLRRWETETLFCALKSRGWRFEDTHVTKQSRIEKLIVLLTIGFVWAHKIGEWKASLKPIPLKKLRQQRRPQNSFFRWGLDNLRDFLTSFKINIKMFSLYTKCIYLELNENCF